MPTEPARRAGAYSIALAICLALACVTSAAIRFRALSRPDILDNIPDDAYLTMDVARTFATTGRLSTSGFQPLYLFAVVPIYAILRPQTTDELDRAALASIVLPVLADLVVLVLLAWLLNRVAGPVAAGVGAWVWAVHPGAIHFATNGLETTCALAAVLAVVAVAEFGPSGRWRDVWLGVAVAVGMLARIDLGVAGAAVVFTTLWEIRSDPNPWPQLWRRIWPMALGWAPIYVPWLAFLYLQTGDLYPISGRATAQLGFGAAGAHQALTGKSYFPWLAAFTVRFLAFGVPVAAVAALALLPAAGRRLKPFRVLVVHCAVLLMVYFGLISAWWHMKRYLAPWLLLETVVIAIAAATLVALYRREIALPSRARLAVNVAMALATGLLLAAIAATSPRDFEHADYRANALSVRDLLAPDEPIAALESGALAYYLAPRRVVNMDGVVNREAYLALRDHRIAEYLDEIGVSTLVGQTFTTDIIKRNSVGRSCVDVAMGAPTFGVYRLLPADSVAGQ